MSTPIVAASIIAETILQLVTAAQTLAAKQASGVPISEADVTDALTLEAVTHDELVALVAAKSAPAVPASGTPPAAP